jgi:hypothetical protein
LLVPILIPILVHILEFYFHILYPQLNYKPALEPVLEPVLSPEMEKVTSMFYGWTIHYNSISTNYIWNKSIIYLYSSMLGPDTVSIAGS